ncbi:metal-dependent phosphoesterase [Cohnella kolymensis]|uniref:Metal-dependent phosphoesterase n=1 Tax=Cohnella kolymensis TaxID=1590652 RepID=A0ABR5A3F5_9BACL|nr:PHP domain-containing protein [Cohnella kolymensis]KIL35228.1 metal-dependent phosphoesterase [Cohnella kolymensis]
MNNRADLHTHTTASDGMNRPSENVRLAKEAGLSAVAITDHDTVAGIPEALEAGERYGISVVPGVEISTALDGRDIHMLGYGISHQDPLLLSRLSSLRNVRNRRNEQILARLAELGMPVSMAEVEAAAGKSGRGSESVGRPHIAQVLMNKGYASDLRDAFDRFLGEGKPAYVSPPRISPFEAVAWIHEAGGAAVVAHPGLYDNDDLVAALLEAGADGVEAFHSDHDAEQEARYSALADRHSKLVTGGSDFHGAREGVIFHGPIGNKTVDAGVVHKLKRL